MKLASEDQVSGNHYKHYPIQPAEFIQKNGLNWCEGNAIKYLVRHRDKKGAEDLRKAKHYIDLLLEWEYGTPLSPQGEGSDALVKDATAESLCLTCGRDPGCIGDYPRTKDGGCEGYVMQPITVPPPETPQDAPTAAERPAPHTDPAWKALDFSLPSFALACTAEEAHRKYCEENAEWLRANIGTLHEMIERWDCLQALRTHAERGGDVRFCQDEEKYICHDLTAYHAKGGDVMYAKAAMLEKNAKRGYYSPKVNAAIIASNGASFTPKEADA